MTEIDAQIGDADEEGGGTAAFVSPYRILLVHGRRWVDHYVERILRATAGEVEVQQGVGQMPPDGYYDILVADYDGLSTGERTLLVESFADYKRDTRLILLSAGAVREDLPTLFGAHMLTNLVARTDATGAQELFVTIQKLLRGEIFGVEKYYAWGAEPIVRRIASSLERDAVMAEALAYARTRGIQPRFIDLFSTTVEELVMNALYNAPTDAGGQYRFAATDRRIPVALQPHEAIVLKFVSDGLRLGVSVADPFGSLSEPLLLEYLAKCFRRDDDQVDQKMGGAGLGLYYVFDCVSNMVVNISPGSRTEVIGLIDVRHGHREFAARGKSFNVFTAGKRRVYRAAIAP